MKLCVRFALALGVLGLGLSAGADEVVSKTLDKPVRGTIVKDDEESVEINIPGGGMTIPVKRADVVRVKYDLLLNHYDAGMSFFEKGQYEEALERFNTSAADKDVMASVLVKQYVLLRLAQCKERMGKYAEAAEAYKRLRSECPRTGFKRESAEGMFNCYLKLEKMNDARAALALLKEGLGEEGKLLAKSYEAELFERDKEYGKAADAYQAVARSEAPPDIRGRAWVGRARCALLSSQAGEARAAAAEALRIKELPPLAAADAHQVLGECLLAGRPSAPAELAKDENREKVLDAIEEMLRTATQYQGSAWAEPRAFHLVALWSERLDASGAIGDWKARMGWARKLLRAKYPHWTPESAGLKK